MHLYFAIAPYVDELQSRPSSILASAQEATASKKGGRRKVEKCSSAPAEGGKFRLPPSVFAEEAGSNKMEGERKERGCDSAHRSP